MQQYEPFAQNRPAVLARFVREVRDGKADAISHPGKQRLIAFIQGDRLYVKTSDGYMLTVDFDKKIAEVQNAAKHGYDARGKAVVISQAVAPKAFHFDGTE